MMDAADRYADEVCDESCTGAQIAETINDFCAGWRAADQHPAWIPIEERLPKENERIIAYNGVFNEIHLCDYHDGVFEDFYGPFDGTITHWMEIVPPQGKEVKNEKG
jgi:hypothetical protein